MDNLLVEIGVEEFPAGYIQPAVEAFALKLSEQLVRGNIKHGDVRTFSTPRRLTVLVKSVASRQKSVVSQVFGPPLNIALDELGVYTLSAIKFAEKIGVSSDQLVKISNHKGSYIGVEKEGLSEKTLSFLERVLPNLILSIPFPKSMRWSDSSIKFARPIRTVVALFGDSVINFELDKKIRSSRNSTGHLFMNPSKVLINNPDEYLNLMREVNVIADFEERRKLVLKGVNKAATSVYGRILNDDNLLDIVTNLIEFPVSAVGNFDKSFLSMPKEILVTAMREHQKYFSVVDDKGDLLPNFIVVNNTSANDTKLVTAGHERVLKARLADTKFFFENDVNTSLDIWLRKLRKVFFHSDLGSMYDKTLRIETIASSLIDVIDLGDMRNDVLRSSRLCKVDLVSQVVMEFPKLQGIMGGIYASLSGESDKVSVGIKEHYLPTKSGGELPKSKIGSLISIADKIDSICGGFIVDLAPTGETDPYALRRQTFGLLRILNSMEFDLLLNELIEIGLRGYKNKFKKNFVSIGKRIHEFLTNRLRGQLQYDGYSLDVIDAVISIQANNVVDVYRRASAIESFRKTNHFYPMVRAFKRVSRIFRGVKNTQYNIEEGLFQDHSEVVLYSVSRNAIERMNGFLSRNEIENCLSTMVSLCEPIDLFFDKVMVLVDNEKVRRNRLALLDYVLRVFSRIADFTKFLSR